jgi:hypothetical protein
MERESPLVSRNYTLSCDVIHTKQITFVTIGFIGALVSQFFRPEDEETRTYCDLVQSALAPTAHSIAAAVQIPKDTAMASKYMPWIAGTDQH